MYSLVARVNPAAPLFLLFPSMLTGRRECSRSAKRTAYPFRALCSPCATLHGQGRKTKTGKNLCMFLPIIHLHNANQSVSVRMMYSALNIRSWLQPQEHLNNSYWFTAIGYFNIVLPTFLPRKSDATDASTFWRRARSVKDQTSKVVKSRMLIPRTKAVSKERGLRSRIWAMQDDGVECTLSMPKQVLFENEKPPPSKALIGLSLLGNLDGTYKHLAFPSITLHTLTTGSRQRQGAMLLFGYTFVGKLWLSLGYDVNGFDDEVVQRFWKHLLASVDELLCN